MSGRDWPWRRPKGREARNEQRKLRAAAFNAAAIAAGITALIGPIINPALSEVLSIPARIGLALLAAATHLLASWLVRDVEDR